MHVTRNTSPVRVLSAAELEQYEANGFVVMPDVVPVEEVSRINREMDRLLSVRHRRLQARQEEARDNGHEALYQLGLQSELTRALCADSRFLDLVAPLVYPGIAIYSAKLVGKPPHCQDICHWHQDDAYYRDRSESDCRMSLWLALDDADAENGGVHFVPGSHRQGLQAWADRDHGHCRRAMDTADLDLDSAVVPTVRAGSVVLFHALTWHYSGPNPTAQRRRAFIVSYQDALAGAGNGEQWKILRPAPGTPTDGG